MLTNKTKLHKSIENITEEQAGLIADYLELLTEICLSEKEQRDQNIDSKLDKTK